MNAERQGRKPMDYFTRALLMYAPFENGYIAVRCLFTTYGKGAFGYSHTFCLGHKNMIDMHMFVYVA